MANLLLLGPDRERAADLRSLLREDGHGVEWIRSIRGWRHREGEMRPELVVAAVGTSADVLAEEFPRAPRGFPAPLLFVRQETDRPEDPYLDDRLVDWIETPFLHEELLARVDALIRVRRVVRNVPVEAHENATIVDEEGSAGGVSGGVRRVGRRLASLLHTRVPRLSKPQDPYLAVAARVAWWADRRDAYQPGHAERVTSFCAMISEGLDLGVHETAALLRAAMLHDIGKVALPVEVLHQRTPLEENQVRMIRTHPRRGAALIRELDRDEDVAEAIHCHHERPDGFGYYGLETERVPIAAKILAVSEVYDGMTTSRMTGPLSSDAALERLEAFKGASLDTDCVDALVDRLKPLPRSVALSPL